MLLKRQDVPAGLAALAAIGLFPPPARRRPEPTAQGSGRIRRGEPQGRARCGQRGLAKDSGKQAVPSYAASSALAKQIEQGAPADIFISADEDWMNYLADAQADQAGHALRSARQHARADRAEGFEDRRPRSPKASRSPRCSATGISPWPIPTRCRPANTARRR